MPGAASARGRLCGQMQLPEGNLTLKAQNNGLPSLRWKGGGLEWVGSCSPREGKQGSVRSLGVLRWRQLSLTSHKWGNKLLKGRWQQNRGSFGSAAAASPLALPRISAPAPGRVRAGADPAGAAEPRGRAALHPCRADRNPIPGPALILPLLLSLRFSLPVSPQPFVPGRQLVQSPRALRRNPSQLPAAGTGTARRFSLWLAGNPTWSSVAPAGVGGRARRAQGVTHGPSSAAGAGPGRSGAAQPRPQKPWAKGRGEISLLAGPESKHRAPGGVGRGRGHW